MTNDEMMADGSRRIYHIRGTPREIGVAMGRSLGERLERNIAHYINRRPTGLETLDLNRLRNGALSFLRSLPVRYQEELEGMALGASIPVQRIAEWVFVDKCIEGGCSGFICHIEGREANFGTVYANVACPSQGKIWYTFGGYPAASSGN